MILIYSSSGKSKNLQMIQKSQSVPASGYNLIEKSDSPKQIIDIEALKKIPDKDNISPKISPKNSMIKGQGLLADSAPLTIRDGFEATCDICRDCGIVTIGGITYFYTDLFADGDMTKIILGRTALSTVSVNALCSCIKNGVKACKFCQHIKTRCKAYIIDKNKKEQ
jgi:hypothetical protein